jgi:hypothetical protein
LTRQIIKARLTTGLPDFPFLRGSHRVEITLYAAHPFATAGLCPCWQSDPAVAGEESQE